MAEETPQGAEEGTDGKVGEETPYQLAVSGCKASMTEGKMSDAIDAYNEAVELSPEAENEELLTLSEQLDTMEDGVPFEFPEAEAEEGAEEKGGEETELESLPEYHEKAGQELEADELKAILKELGISFNILTGQAKLQKKFDEYNIEKGYDPEAAKENKESEENEEEGENDWHPQAGEELSQEELQAIMIELQIEHHPALGQKKLQLLFDGYNMERGFVVEPEEEEEEELAPVEETRGRKAEIVGMDEAVEACKVAIIKLQTVERQQRAAGKSSRRFRRAWQTINSQVIRKMLRVT